MSNENGGARMKNPWLLLKNQTLKEYRQNPTMFWVWIFGCMIIGLIYGLSKGCSHSPTELWKSATVS